MYKNVIGLHQLPKTARNEFLKEIGLVGEALVITVHPQKLNYEILGNTDPHLHCHIFPRYENDPNPSQPIWLIDQKIRNAAEFMVLNAEREELKKNLKRNIESIL